MEWGGHVVEDGWKMAIKGPREPGEKIQFVTVTEKKWTFTIIVLMFS